MACAAVKRPYNFDLENDPAKKSRFVCTPVAEPPKSVFVSRDPFTQSQIKKRIRDELKRMQRRRLIPKFLDGLSNNKVPGRYENPTSSTSCSEMMQSLSSMALTSPKEIRFDSDSDSSSSSSTSSSSPSHRRSSHAKMARYCPSSATSKGARNKEHNGYRSAVSHTGRRAQLADSAASTTTNASDDASDRLDFGCTATAPAPDMSQSSVVALAENGGSPSCSKKSPSKEASSSSSSVIDSIPLFTLSQVTTLCEKIVREREDKLRVEYDKVLTCKLAEQFETLSAYANDQIYKLYENSPMSYVS